MTPWPSWLACGLLVLGCDGAPRAQAPAATGQPQELTTTSASPPGVASSSPPAATPVPEASAASLPAAPAAYPEASIERARREFGRSCQNLVYKRGCAETRTGRVWVRFTLDAEGKVSKLEIVKNEIRREPEVVATCLKKELPGWKFDPPGAAEPSFELELAFSDKC